MKECEGCEIQLSAWLDGELERPGQEEMLDHLVRCGGCRDFYQDARGLSGLVAAVRNPAGAPAPSPEVWRRIERSARAPMAGRFAGWGGGMRRFPIRGWAAAAAAAALLVIFGSLVNREREPAFPPGGEEVVRLGRGPADMDDARFVALTREVLGADRKYRTAFYEVMKQVVRETDESEGSVDLFPSGEERGGEEESPETTGGPS